MNARLRRGAIRGTALLIGLVGYGASMALMVRGGLGLAPWGVLDQGVSVHTPLSLGAASAVIGALVLLAWIPLRVRPGIGTVSNVIVIAITIDATLALLPEVTSMPARVALMLAGVALNAVSTVLYVGAGLGPGPRDGLMTGLVQRTGRSVRLVRSTIEICVLAVGWLLGGTVGVGTVVYAFGIGPSVQLVLRLTPKSWLRSSGWSDVLRLGDLTRTAPARESSLECGTMVPCPQAATPRKNPNQKPIPTF